MVSIVYLLPNHFVPNGSGLLKAKISQRGMKTSNFNQKMRKYSIRMHTVCLLKMVGCRGCVSRGVSGCVCVCAQGGMCRVCVQGVCVCMCVVYVFRGCPGGVSRMLLCVVCVCSGVCSRGVCSGGVSRGMLCVQGVCTPLLDLLN